MKCPKCQSGDITIKTKRDNRGFFLGCLSFPDCNATLWLPDSLEQISVIEEQCQECLPRVVKKVKLKFKPGSMRPFYPDLLECCLGGCDTELLDILGARPITSAGNSSTSSNTTRQPPTRNASSDSGYESANHSISRRNNSTNNTSSAFPLRSQSTSGVGNAPRQSISSSGQQFPRNPFRPVPDQDNRPSAPSDDVVCNCNKKAIILTTRKEGQNQGRQFYKCPEPAGIQCDFFLWKDEENSHSTSTNIQTQPQNNFNARPQNNFPPSRLSSNSDQNENSNGTVMCRCGEAAPLLTVRKEGPNKGKKFYGCSQGMGTGCGFFQWAEEDSSSADLFPGPAARGFDRNSAGPSHGRFGGSSKKRPAADSGGSANKQQRKCGICGEAGHNRRVCPQSR
ncbi:hypothetical protein JTE90_027998 [Oedothorax gibbosus]|uniref:DNA topoisomerase n=1 Tax=Oedothorax gibbosus TaxID=931172 RepID=A0AAV6VF99_9ARAC|nr:hypothetical protein JTE90_027998 [Oedothorax gibbosus]